MSLHSLTASPCRDRFRTLQFNLSKPDRVVIHKRITFGRLSAKEISVMSSTDLADEETKQSIKLAEKEALEHSILQKQIAPRAKITHKGLQDIEDIRGEIASAQEYELQKEREREEEERRERERLARLRTSTTQVNRQRTASISLPPESPTVPPSSAGSLDGPQEQWGGPPPIPLHVMVNVPMEEMAQGHRPPLFIQSSSDYVPSVEPELNLDDLINIDEDQESAQAMTGDADPAAGLISAQPNVVSSPTEMTFEKSPATGISPFAQRQDRTRAPSFDLSALWTESIKEVPAGDEEPKITATEDEAGKARVDTAPDQEPRDDSDNMELESVEANDQDFDMFLADEPATEVELPSTVPSVPPSVEGLPQVWTGKVRQFCCAFRFVWTDRLPGQVTMPLDSGVPQETTLVARQIGGKSLPADSPLWKTLFPSDVLRIEGRVPVDNAIKYLVQMRMNPTKELYAAAFIPAGPQNEEDFKSFNTFLISKRWVALFLL